MPEEKKDRPLKASEKGQPQQPPQVPEFKPTVSEVNKDAFDRGNKEGRSLDEQRPAPRDSKEPQQISHDDTRYVHLPGLISDEFGTARSEARLQIAMGTVTVDGEEVATKDNMDLPYDSVVGKTIVVQGPHKTFTIDYRG